MRPWLEGNGIEIYSTHNAGKFVFTKRFVKKLKNKMYKYMTSISRKVYIENLDNIVIKYNHTYDSTIKMKYVDVKSST